ncbi:MAG: RNA polymerase sigma factor, partial [Clostridiales bacterium]|nr:RNA polymerase sigma factor [Clostridiales bacterium]
DILRLPRGTVSSRLSRGLRMLKQQIDKEEQGRG